MAEPTRSPRRVLMLVDQLADGTGGAERFAVGLALALPRQRFEASVCVTRTADGYLLAQLEAAGVPCLQLGRSGRWDLAPLRRLGAVLRTRRFEVLHCHKFGSNFWGTVIGSLSGVPVVVAHEQTWSYEGQLARKVIDGQVIGRLADKFVAVSDADRRRMIELEGVRPDKTITIPNGYVPRPDTGTGDLRKELGIDHSAPVIGTVSQLRPQKAFDVLLEAFGSLQARLPDARLVIVGDGPSRGELEAHARYLNLEGVYFTGTRTDLRVIFAAFDVAVMSSDYEGLPLFAFECMRYQTPLVATAVGGLPDLIEDGRTGLLVPPRHPGALGDALEGLLRDRARRDSLVAAATELLAGYSMDRIGQRFADLYDELLASKAPTTSPRG